MGRLSEIPQECLQKSKNASIYRQIGRNRPIDAFNPHQRSGLNASNQTVMNISWPSDRGWTLRIDLLDMRFKNALNRDRWITIQRSGCVAHD